MDKDYRQYLGIPFVPHGRTRTGCDCWGLVRLVYKDWFDIDLPLFGGHEFDVNNPLAAAKLMAEGVALDIWRDAIEPTRGNILLFGGGPAPYHVGIWLTPELMLHTRHGIDASTERHNALIWGARRWGIFTHKDLV